MTKRFYFILFFFFLFFSESNASEQFSSSSLISTGEIFPTIKLSATLSKEDARYLGIRDNKEFYIKDLKADLILVEILNTFCFSCQKQAPVYNELYQRLQNDPNTRERVKILGIAVGNTREAIDEFKKKYNVIFPIIPDEDYKVYEAIGGARTPFSIFLRKDENHPDGLVVKTHLGVSYRYDIIFQDIIAMLTMDKNSLLSISRVEKRDKIKEEIKPVFTDDQVMEFLRTSLKEEGYSLKNILKINLSDFSGLFSIKIEDNKGESTSLIAHMVSKPPTCGICHDIHFIYTFDGEGKIRGFYPIQLTKYGNVPWSNEDLSKFRREVLGKFISRPWVGKPDVQIVTSATITTSVIFHNLSKGERLFKALRDRNLI